MRVYTGIYDLKTHFLPHHFHPCLSLVLYIYRYLPLCRVGIVLPHVMFLSGIIILIIYIFTYIHIILYDGIGISNGTYTSTVGTSSGITAQIST